MVDLPTPELPDRYFETVAEVLAKDPVAFVRAFSSTSWGPITDAVKKGRLDRFVEAANVVLDAMVGIEEDYRYISPDRVDGFCLDLVLDGVVPADRLVELLVSGADATGPHGEPVIRLAVEELGIDAAPEWLSDVRAFGLLQAEIDEDLGKKRAMELLKKPLQAGMTAEEVDLFFRDDFDETEELLKTKVKTHRVWTGESIKQKREINALRVTFEEGRVVGWDDKRKAVKDATRPELLRDSPEIWGEPAVKFPAMVCALWMCEQGGMPETQRAEVLDAVLAWGRAEDRWLWWFTSTGARHDRGRQAMRPRMLRLMNGAMVPLPVDDLIARCAQWGADELEGHLGKQEAAPPPARRDDDDDDDDDDKESGACFVATACFEPRDAPLLDTLRDWRDGRLPRTGPGRAFLAGYDVVGPPLAGFIAPRDRLRRALRALMLPVGRAIAADHLRRD